MAVSYVVRRSEIVAHTDSTLLTGIAAVTLLSLQPHRRAKYELTVDGLVVTAATTVTVTLTWTDPADASVQQTVNVINAIDEPLGPFQARYGFTAAGDTGITVTVTAGTANQVTVRAVVEKKALV